MFDLRYEPVAVVLRGAGEEAVRPGPDRGREAQARGLPHLAPLLQPLRDAAVPLLGGVRPRQPPGLRADGREGLHSVLGPLDVRCLLLLQHDRPPQHADCNDVKFLSVNLSQIGHVSWTTFTLFFQTENKHEFIQNKKRS